MTCGWAAFGAGVFVGTWLGILVVALCVAARDGDERRRR